MILPNIALVCPTNHYLLSNESPIVVIAREPRGRLVLYLGDWMW
jgi:hypothetical protein